MKIPALFLPALAGLLLGPLCGLHAASSPDELRAAAKRSYDSGNWKDALEIYERLLKNPDLGGGTLEDELNKAVECQNRLGQPMGFDALVEAAVKAHAKDWRLLRAAGNSYFVTNHWGTIIGNVFQRGSQGTGKRVGSEDRDRVRGLQLLEQAMKIVSTPDGDVEVHERARLFQEFQQLMVAREGWELQALTDLKTLPDYDETMQNYYYGGRQRYRGAYNMPTGRGAPVDEKGEPVFYHMPESWDAAKSDGERWRWLLKQWGACGDEFAAEADVHFAQFLKAEFDVQTIAQWWRPSGDEDVADKQNSLLTLHTLKENETIARLATGVKRFTLPDEFNFIAILERVGAKTEFKSAAWEALNSLAESFQNRRQLPRAAEVWRQALALHYYDQGAQAALDQIVKNWCRFDASLVQTPGQGATVGFVFRNGTKAKFTARKIKFQQLLADVKKYIASDPETLDWQRTNFQQIGYSILEDHFSKYIGEKVADWSVDLEPRKNHWDRRIDVTTPLQTAGAYFVESEIEGGNKSGIVVWISDTAIVKKQGASEAQFYVVDAATGAPVSGATLEFFGYRNESIPNREQHSKRYYHTITRNFAEKADEQGQFFSKQDSVPPSYTWLVTATTKDGRFAHLGWTGVWYNGRSPEFYEQTKIYTITDRPVYRPGQSMKFKAWVRRANYDAPIDKSEFAHEKFNVEIHDAKGEKVYDKSLETDEYGGLKDELTLKEDATLGVYSFQIRRAMNGEHFYQHGTFRVEEYKKPEFEVKVDAPSDPVALGEKVSAKVTAKYYFGAPVVNAKVKYKVQRSSYTDRWYPVREWDWFYGPGYWWFGYDYFWYPGFSKWGCLAPVWWWWNPRAEPPELVTENEVAIGADGTVPIEIDTALAKELHPDEDQRYEVSVEVTDESRRTILGSGSVLVAREPFKVNVWTDRGHYEAKQPIEVGIKAQTLDHKGVKGKTKVSLLKIGYDEKGQPKEKEVAVENIATNEEGSAKVKFTAADAGQYRLSAKVSDGKNHEMEGGYIFVVRGKGKDGGEFRFNDLELVAEKAEYEAGETIKLMINTAHADSTVFFFVRSQGTGVAHPKVLRLQGKSITQEIKVETGDMPNFFIEAFSVSDGKVHAAVREIAVPPAKRVLNLEVLADSNKHKPHEKAKVKLRLTDLDGKPFVGSTVVTVYDKALEYISGGSNVPDIKEYFWKWRRHYNSQTENSLLMQLVNQNMPRTAPGMNYIGVFGYDTGDLGDDKAKEGRDKDGASVRKRKSGFGGDMSGNVALGGFAMTRSGVVADSIAPAAPMSAMKAEAQMEAAAKPASTPAQEPGGVGQAVPEVMIRSEFADSIYWTAALETNAEGIAEIEVPLPDNLTTWKIRSWGMGHGTRVGEGSTEIITSKDLILRQQAPRFFVEKDEVTLSANVHNYLPDKKEVKVVLELEGSCLEAMSGQQLTQTITLDSQKEQRVDWRVKAVREGTAVVRIKAIADGDSDAMEMKYPVFVHGTLKTDSFSGAIRPEDTVGKITITVPNERRPDQSRLEVRYSPTIATAILDAVPYLVDYPYGCTEQTLNRFLPAAQARKLLTDMGVDLKAIQKKRTNLNPQEIGKGEDRAKQWKRYDRNPIFSEGEYKRIVKQGVEKLTAMQNRDGGWGWFSGDREESYPHTTAVVVHGLMQARAAGVTIIPNVIERGQEWLAQYQRQQVEWIKNYKIKDAHPSKEKADNLDAFVFFVIAEGGGMNKEMRDFLYRDRNDLAVYAKCTYALGLDLKNETEKRDMLRKNIEQYLVMDAENQTARLDVRNGGYWWWWYGSDIETQAFYLKLLSRVEPKSDKASGLVKFLINNRKNATYWNSTRDTAYCVEALNDYLKATKEAEPNVTVEVLLDGVKKKEVQINKENLFSYDNSLILEGAAVPAGKHTVEVKKKGNSPIYFNAYVTNFTLEDRITKAGLEVKIERRYYKLIERKDAKAQVSGSRGQVVQQNVLKYDREPLKDGDVLKSGELVEAELIVESKNDYEYLLFEDMKPAGFEADDVRSGYDYSTGLPIYREFHDERVSMFARTLPLGKHSMTYRLRAEVPGKFSALPAKAHAMYAPELRANSDEFKVGVRD